MHRPGHPGLGTWNIRNFDNNRFGNGPRLEETFLYIAEVISRDHLPLWVELDVDFAEDYLDSL